MTERLQRRLVSGHVQRGKEPVCLERRSSNQRISQALQPSTLTHDGSVPTAMS